MDHLEKTKKEYKSLKKQDIRNILSKNKLHKAFFQHDKACGDFKDLTRRTASDKILRDKALNVAKNPKYDGCQRGFASLIYNIFDKKSSGDGIKSKIVSNKELWEELHKPFIEKFEKRQVISFFIDNIWGSDFPEIQLRRKCNEGIFFSVCVLLIFSVKSHGLFLSKVTITNAFQKTLKESNRKTNKIWVD